MHTGRTISDALSSIDYDADAQQVIQARSTAGPLHLYTVCSLIAVLCLVYLDIPYWLYTRNQAFLPKYFFYAFSIAITPVVVFRLSSLSSYLRSPFSLWALTLISLNVAHLLVALGDGDQIRANLIGTKIQYAILAVLLGFACSTVRPISFERIFPLLALAIVALVAWDFLNPGMLYPLDADGAVLGRAAGTLVNPNKAGEVMLLTFLLALPALRPWYRAVFLLLLGAVVLTFSRSAILGWMFLWAFLLLVRAIPTYTFAIPLVALAALPLLLGSFEDYLSGRADIADGLTNIQQRLDFFQSQVVEDDSALERAQVLDAGLELFLQNPVFGAGAGATDVWWMAANTHNEPVMLGAQYGVFGLALWVWLGVILYRGNHFRGRYLQVAMTGFFVFVSMFVHSMFEAPWWLLTFAIVTARPRA